MKRRFKDLSAAEILALAISLEEEDARIYQEFARLLRPDDPKAAEALDSMKAIEDGHRRRLIEIVRAKFGEMELETARRLFVLQVVQPGLAGLMDGSVSTLAPLFVAAWVTPFRT